MWNHNQERTGWPCGPFIDLVVKVFVVSGRVKHWRVSRTNRKDTSSQSESYPEGRVGALEQRLAS